MLRRQTMLERHLLESLPDRCQECAGCICGCGDCRCYEVIRAEMEPKCSCGRHDCTCNKDDELEFEE